MEISPCDRLRPGRLIGEKKPRQRVLSDGELTAFWRATRRLGYPYGSLFRLLAITGQRKGEVAETRWREFHPGLARLLRERKPGAGRVDWGKIGKSLKVWSIPPEQFRSDPSHLVPLSDKALEIFESLPHCTGSNAGDHLFSSCFGAKPVNGFSNAKERLDRLMVLTVKAMARKRGPMNARLSELLDPCVPPLPLRHCGISGSSQDCQGHWPVGASPAGSAKSDPEPVTVTAVSAVPLRQPSWPAGPG